MRDTVVPFKIPRNLFEGAKETRKNRNLTSLFRNSTEYLLIVERQVIPAQNMI